MQYIPLVGLEGFLGQVVARKREGLLIGIPCAGALDIIAAVPLVRVNRCAVVSVGLKVRPKARSRAHAVLRNIDIDKEGINAGRGELIGKGYLITAVCSGLGDFQCLAGLCGVRIVGNLQCGLIDAAFLIRAGCIRASGIGGGSGVCLIKIVIPDECSKSLILRWNVNGGIQCRRDKIRLRHLSCRFGHFKIERADRQAGNRETQTQKHNDETLCFFHFATTPF